LQQIIQTTHFSLQRKSGLTTNFLFSTFRKILKRKLLSHEKLERHFKKCVDKFLFPASTKNNKNVPRTFVKLPRRNPNKITQQH